MATSSSSFLPGTASLLEEIDKKLMVLLRDGRTLIGYLRSIDQFANLVLHRTIERIHVGDKFGDMPRGIFLIRGENVVLCGEVPEDEEYHSSLTKVDPLEILELQAKELAVKQEKERLRMKAIQESGLSFNYEALHDDLL